MGWSAAAAVRAPHTFPCPLGLGFEPLASRSRWRRAARSSARRAISIILMACSRSSGGSESRSGPSPFTALRRFPSSFGALCQGTRVRGASGAWERAARARPGAGPAARLEAAAHLSSLASGRGRLRSGSGAKPRVSGASWDRSALEDGSCAECRHTLAGLAHAGTDGGFLVCSDSCGWGERLCVRLPRKVAT